VLRKIFCEFDTNKNGKLHADELKEMLLKLEIPIEDRLLEGIVSKIARSNEGYFDFEDLAQFVFYDPYHI
jgi:Ca2+-binding EF-hand superfamily protein